MPSKSNSTRHPPSHRQPPLARSASARQPPPPSRTASTRRDFALPSRNASTTWNNGPGAAAAPRPKPLERSETAHSHYVNMLLSQDSIPKFHTVAAAICVWLLLAGFLIFPGTFTSLQETIDGRDAADRGTEAAEAVLSTVKNIPLLVIGAVACGISAAGMISLLIRHRVNFVWLLNRLLIPGMVNSLAGLISTLIGVYTQQDGTWSITAKVTAIVEGAYLCACAALFGFYTYKLEQVKKRHGQFYEDGVKKDSQTQREQQKEEAAALEPGGSIV